jgi:hypothetical protein
LGKEIGEDLAADDTDNVHDRAADHAGGLDDLVTRGVERHGEAGPVRVDVGPDDRGVDSTMAILIAW